MTGGTGPYRTAHGELRIQELTTTDWQATLRIILQGTEQPGGAAFSGGRPHYFHGGPSA